MNPRNQLRQQIRQQRRALTEQERESAAFALADNILQSREFKHSQHLALYLANDGEISLAPLLDMAWSMGKQCYLPVLAEPNNKRLWFIQYEPGDLLLPNRFGIPEPHHSHRERLFKTISLDMILMPLVAFDQQGNRLGMGGGYYDRTLAFMRSRQHWRKPRLVGVAYEFQQQPSLPHEHWDVPLDSIITDQQHYHIQP